MKIITKLLSMFFISASLFFIACEGGTEPETDPLLGSSNVVLSGDITNAYNADCVAGMVQEDSTSGFVVYLKPQNSTSSEQLSLVKLSQTLPPVGLYKIGENVDSGEDFFGAYSIADTSIYFMHSGTVEITESGSSKVSGKFNLEGYYFDWPIDSTRVLTVKGDFSTVPISL